MHSYSFFFCFLVSFRPGQHIGGACMIGQGIMNGGQADILIVLVMVI